MKWTAYYNAKNLFTNEVDRVYLGKSFKTKMELVDYLKGIGFAAPDYLLRDNQMAKYNMRKKAPKLSTLLKSN